MLILLMPQKFSEQNFRRPDFQRTSQIQVSVPFNMIFPSGIEEDAQYFEKSYLCRFSLSQMIELI